MQSTHFSLEGSIVWGYIYQVGKTNVKNGALRYLTNKNRAAERFASLAWLKAGSVCYHHAADACLIFENNSLK